MAITHFDNGTIKIILGTKADGNFRTYPLSGNMQEAQKFETFLHKLNIDRVSVLYPAKNTICYSDGSERVIHAQGIISKPSVHSRAWGIPAADCLPLIIINPETRSVGLLHLGWKEIYRNTASKFAKEWLKTNPSSKDAALLFIGPHICQNCFSLEGWKGWLRLSLFYTSSLRKFIRKNKKKYSFDLRAAALSQFETVGMRPHSLNMSPECTFEDTQFSSCRREGATRTSANFFIVQIK